MSGARAAAAAMLTTQTTGALVAGSAPAAGAPARKWVRVERAFVYGGRVVEAGAELDLDATFAAMLVAANKARRIAAPAAAASPPPAPAPAPRAPTPSSGRRAAATGEPPC